MSRPRVLVTGGRRGIGRGIALAFAAAGYDVAVNDLVEDEAAVETLAVIEAAGGRAVFIPGDIADLGGHARLLDRAEGGLGRIDVLVNNAGISVRQRGDMLEVTPESFDALIGVNLRAPFFLTQALAKRWLAGEAGPHRRSVITISSANVEVLGLNRAEYCLAKSALPMMTKLFAVRLAEAGIGVFEIRPGIIRTDMTMGAKERYDRLIGEGLTPIRRWGEPDDVGRAAVALASGAFGFSVGEAIHVDGGLCLKQL